MTDPTDPVTPLPVIPAPYPLDQELELLLGEPLATLLAEATPAPPGAGQGVRAKLLQRLAASRTAMSGKVTARPSRLPAHELAPGVVARNLYQAPTDRPLRPGEPLRTRLVQLFPGSHWTGPDADTHRECLLLRGSARLGRQSLQVLDFAQIPAGTPTPALGSTHGALLMLREARPCAAGEVCETVVRHAGSAWDEHAPGVWRRVLWQHGGQASMLYCAAPGAIVPSHRHVHDEECLMVRGELFLDELLLREGEYQLGPAGTSHAVTDTDTGAIIYAHGDLDMRFEL